MRTRRVLVPLLGVLASAAALPRLSAQVVINEVLASNRLTNEDDDGDPSDWLELTNTGSEAADLAGYTLTDEPSAPLKWTLPSFTLSPGQSSLIWCSGKDRTTVPAEKIVAAGSTVPFEPSLVDLDAVWRYLTGAPTDPGPPAGWTALEFDDAPWPQGKPGFGFGDDDDTTIITPGSGAVFLRHKFAFDPALKLPNLILQARFDDGFVAYLNGTRILSVNFGETEEPTLASLANKTTEARTVARFDLTQHLGLLKPGDNMLAMVLLNRTVAGDDLSLFPELGHAPPILHTSFSLDANGETIVLSRPDGTLADTVALPRQNEDQSYGRSPSGTGPFLYLLHATPGSANDGPASPDPLVVADTKFSVHRGFHDAPFDLEITTATPGAEVRYTLDGTPPTETAGQAYAGPIHITGTSTVRAAAFRQDWKPTNVDTHTYVFVDDIVRQDFQATLDRGFPRNWGPTPADYGMDPDVIGQGGTDKYGGKYAATIRDDLKSLPTVSIVLPVPDMFGPTGIYTNSENRGTQWERAASIELIEPDGSEGFHANAGIRMHGGAFRSHGLTKKHSMRFRFKAKYGPSKLKFPLFEYASSTDSFEGFVLRANSNDGWQWDAAGAKPLYIRDSFSRETSLAMGVVSSHEKFVHVYIDGVYWGVYDLVERPDAAFCATYFGGEREEWDSVSNDAASSGDLIAWNKMLTLARPNLTSDAAYQAIQGNQPDGTDDPALDSYLDVPNLIDYMIINLYVGNTDWPHKNWWSGRRKIDSTGFKFFLWDTEWSMGLQSDLSTNQVSVTAGVSAPYAAARGNAEFRMLFADHVQKHFSQGGALYVDPVNRAWDPAHPERNAPAARFAALADEVERALVAESARWGDQHVAKPYTRDEHWRVERDNLLKTYLPQRSNAVLQQFKAAKLFPATEAPILSRRGGEVPAGFQVLLSAKAGEIYYTLDGTDPRLPGGAASGSAVKLPPLETSLLVPPGAEARYLVPPDDSLGLDWTSVEYPDASWQKGPMGLGFEGQTGLETEVATNVGAAMQGVSASIYVRLAFNVSSPSQFSFLKLRMKYDDGFAAYLNGVLVASQNAPQPAGAISNATRSHADTAAVQFEDLDISGAVGLLRAGPNLLAIHGLNLRATDDDFLVSASLEAAKPDGQSIRIDGTTRLRARALNGTEWSALEDALFVVSRSFPLVISEVMYHPEAPSDGGSHGAEDFEFIELMNAGPAPLDLKGVRLEGAVTFDFTDSSVTSIGPGGFVLVVKDLDAFASRYGTNGFAIAGAFKGNLSNGGEELLLKGPRGETLLDFAYSDEWFPETDGGGSSLVIADSLAAPEALEEKSGWAQSAAIGGSPGAADPSTRSHGGLQLPGDFNQDGKRNVSDAISILLRLFRGAQGPLPCGGESMLEGGNLAVFDWNGDFLVNLTDAVGFLAYMFQAGPPPALGPTCTSIDGCADICAR